MGWLGNIIKGVGGALPGIGTAVQIGSGILGAVTGAKKDSKANAQSKQALDMALQRRNETAPLRNRALQMATQGMQTPREDLSSIFRDPGNPYSRLAPRPVATPMAQAQPMAPPMVNPPQRQMPGQGGGIGSALQRALQVRQ